MGREKGNYESRKWKKSKRAPIHTGIVIDEVEEKRKAVIDDEIAQREENQKENESRRKL